MKTNPYYLKARLFPTILTAIPAITFYNYFVAPLYYENLANVFSTLPIITNVTFSAAIVFLFTQLNRFVSKELFQRLYFEDELKMPTTNHLLWADTFFEDGIKRRVRTKIRGKYNIALLSAEEERADETRARKLITTAISQVRISLKDNQMLFQHNIEFGFFRNLVGGSFIALLFVLLIAICSFLQDYQGLKLIALLFLIIYLIPIAISKFFIQKYGNYYSKILYEQFLHVAK